MPYRTVLFDLDGTLLDHFAAIHRCHAYTMKRLGLPEPTLAQVHAAVGAGVGYLMGSGKSEVFTREVDVNTRYER